MFCKLPAPRLSPHLRGAHAVRGDADASCCQAVNTTSQHPWAKPSKHSNQLSAPSEEHLCHQGHHCVVVVPFVPPLGTTGYVLLSVATLSLCVSICLFAEFLLGDSNHLKTFFVGTAHVQFADLAACTFFSCVGNGNVSWAMENRLAV
eukprot:TRINITY_DN12103_c0_g1_i2.p1 TRINITY_DN12103_c0_g1~~TRINITY_DN12103_c0_g1_i2.p1  ORF type:complete len:148 (-),score=7.73 TRINITY_DN12103_c0_g1_i2:325-768(-)